MEINYSLANDILEEANYQLKILSSKTNLNEVHYKEIYKIISKTILNLSTILDRSDIINETYCIIETTLVDLEKAREHFVSFVECTKILTIQ